jgi:hypothetical protein
MGRGLPIREDVVTASELRGLAKKEPRRRTAQRRLAIANALEGMSRAQAARAAGIERQSRRDAVLRVNAEGGLPPLEMLLANSAGSGWVCHEPDEG